MALDNLHELLQDHVEYWRIRQNAREHLASIQDLSTGSVKQEIRRHLKSSGSALKLQNLAYSVRHGLLLPFDVPQETEVDKSASARPTTQEASASMHPEANAQASQVSIKPPNTPESVSSRASPVSTASPLHTTFSLQECIQPSPQAGAPKKSMSAGTLISSPDDAGCEAPGKIVGRHSSLQHGDSALPTKELHEAAQPQHRPKQPQEPAQLQLLRDHWQAVVVDRLMRVAARSSEPLARRARDPDELARLRAIDVASDYAGNGDPGIDGDSGTASAVHRIGRVGSLERPPLGKPPVDTPIISLSLLKRGVSAALQGKGHVPDCEQPGDAAELDLPEPTVPSSPDVICPEIEARVPTWAQLRERFADMHPRLRHVGVDDSACEWFAARSLAVAAATSEGHRLPEARSVLRRGAPNSQRRAMWCLALCLPQSLARVGARCNHGDQRFIKLCETVESRQLLTDALISHSVSALSNSDDFFLFTETIRAATLALSRDSSIPDNSAVPAHPRLIGLGKGGQRHGLYPPCGVLPPSWLSCLAAPLAYVFGDAEGVFYCTRALYCRYWCKLSSLSAEGGPSPCIPVLVATFRWLLNEAEPDLETHLHSIGFSPAHCATEWIVSGFVNVLDVEEVLLLWDRVIGFDTLLVLAVAAAGIFTWRAHMLRSCSKRCEAVAAVQHLAGVRAVPLLQSVLFLCGSGAAAALGIDEEQDTVDLVYAA